MSNFFWVFLGGGLGSICRYGIAKSLESSNFNFPLATLLANALACIILGYLVGLQLKADLSDTMKLMLMTGFCGGFSTFSTFSNETLQLFQNGQILYAMINIGLSLIICLAFIFIGIKLASS